MMAYYFTVCFTILVSTTYAYLSTYSFNDDEIRTIVNEHNRLRALEPAQNMQEMVWNYELAEIAKDWASRCVGSHRPDRSNRAGFVAIGENLWWATFRVADLRRVFRDFYDEKRYYDFNTGYCSTEMCGHYTQVVWANSCSVGCAAAFCDRIYNGRGVPSGMMIACNYGPSGNYYFQKPYVYGQQCQMCPGSCTNGLCPSTCRGYKVTANNNYYYNNNYSVSYQAQKYYPQPQHYVKPVQQPKSAVPVKNTQLVTRRPSSNTYTTRSYAANRNTNWAWALKTTPKLNTRGCINWRADCPKFRQQGLCYLQKTYMMTYCRKECDPACSRF